MRQMKHAHRVNTIAIHTQYVLRTGGYDHTPETVGAAFDRDKGIATFPSPQRCPHPPLLASEKILVPNCRFNVNCIFGALRDLRLSHKFCFGCAGLALQRLTRQWSDTRMSSQPQSVWSQVRPLLIFPLLVSAPFATSVRACLCN